VLIEIHGHLSKILVLCTCADGLRVFVALSLTVVYSIWMQIDTEVIICRTSRIAGLWSSV